MRYHHLRVTKVVRSLPGEPLHGSTPQGSFRFAIGDVVYLRFIVPYGERLWGLPIAHREMRDDGPYYRRTAGKWWPEHQLELLPPTMFGLPVIPNTVPICEPS